MKEVFVYWIMQKLGYRKFYYDMAFYRGINLTSFEGWLWRPQYSKGTYRENNAGWLHVGYGVDK